MRAKSDTWHKADIKAALEKEGLTMAAVARSNGVTPAAVRRALLGARPMTRVKAMVASAIGIPPQTIWPGLFNEHGQPIPTKRRSTKVSRSGYRRKVSGGIQGAA